MSAETVDIVDEAGFIEVYGGHVLEVETVGRTLSVPLSGFVSMEQRFCKADPEKRVDPATRLRFLARKVGKEALLPEHHYLLGEEEG